MQNVKIIIELWQKNPERIINHVVNIDCSLFSKLIVRKLICLITLTTYKASTTM